jgi:hypothetical protein
MIVLELDEVEVDYCTECEGIWLDAGELELLLGSTAAAQQLLESFNLADTDEAARKCPICRKKMEKVRVGQSDGRQELLDRCKKEHGLWFDRDELQGILTLGHFDDEGRVRNLLGELFRTDKSAEDAE